MFADKSLANCVRRALAHCGQSRNDFRAAVLPPSRKRARLKLLYVRRLLLVSGGVFYMSPPALVAASVRS